MGPDVDVSATKPVVGSLCQECFVLFLVSVMGGVLDVFAPESEAVCDSDSSFVVVELAVSFRVVVEVAQVEDVGLELAEF